MIHSPSASPSENESDGSCLKEQRRISIGLTDPEGHSTELAAGQLGPTASLEAPLLSNRRGAAGSRSVSPHGSAVSGLSREDGNRALSPVGSLRGMSPSPFMGQQHSMMGVGPGLGGLSRSCSPNVRSLSELDAKRHQTSVLRPSTAQSSRHERRTDTSDSLSQAGKDKKEKKKGKKKSKKHSVDYEDDSDAASSRPPMSRQGSADSLGQLDKKEKKKAKKKVKKHSMDFEDDSDAASSRPPMSRQGSVDSLGSHVRRKDARDQERRHPKATPPTPDMPPRVGQPVLPAPRPPIAASRPDGQNDKHHRMASQDDNKLLAAMAGPNDERLLANLSAEGEQASSSGVKDEAEMRNRNRRQLGNAMSATNEQEGQHAGQASTATIQAERLSAISVSGQPPGQASIAPNQTGKSSVSSASGQPTNRSRTQGKDCTETPCPVRSVTHNVSVEVKRFFIRFNPPTLAVEWTDASVIGTRQLTSLHIDVKDLKDTRALAMNLLQHIDCLNPSHCKQVEKLLERMSSRLLPVYRVLQASGASIMPDALPESVPLRPAVLATPVAHLPAGALVLARECVQVPDCGMWLRLVGGGGWVCASMPPSLNNGEPERLLERCEPTVREAQSWCNLCGVPFMEKHAQGVLTQAERWAKSSTAEAA